MQCCIACVDHTLSIRSFVGGRLWAAVNAAAADSDVHMPLQGPAFHVFRRTSGRGTDASYGNPVFDFFEGLPYRFPAQLHRFTAPQQRTAGKEGRAFWFTQKALHGPAAAQHARSHFMARILETWSPAQRDSLPHRTPHKQLSPSASHDCPAACLTPTTHPLARSLAHLCQRHSLGLTHRQAAFQALRTHRGPT